MIDIKDIRQRASEAEFAEFSPEYMLGETLSYLGSSAFYKTADGEIFEMKPLALGSYALLQRYDNTVFDHHTDGADAFEFLFHCYKGKEIMSVINHHDQQEYINQLMEFTQALEISVDTATVNSKLILRYALAGFSLIPMNQDENDVRIKHLEWDSEYMTSIISSITGLLNMTPMQILWDIPMSMVCFFYAQALKMKGVQNIGRIGDIRAANEIMKEVFEDG